jgi:hypothetical protein
MSMRREVPTDHTEYTDRFSSPRIPFREFRGLTISFINLRFAATASAMEIIGYLVVSWNNERCRHAKAQCRTQVTRLYKL